MHGTGAKYIFLLAERYREKDRERAGEWRVLHRHPDVTPLPLEPAKEPGRVARAYPTLRRLLLGLG